MKPDPNTPKEQLFPNATLYVEGGRYYLKITLEKGVQPERSLKVKYDPDNPGNKTIAVARATDIYRDLTQKHDAGLPLKNTTVARLAEEHLAHARKAYLTNKALEDRGLPMTEEIEGGRGMWTRPHYLHHKRTIRMYITHPKISADEKAATPWVRYFDDSRNNKSIERMTQKDINAWIEWKRGIFLKEENPKKHNGTIKKQHTVLRHIFKLAVRKGIINNYPPIPDPHTSVEESARPAWTKEQWEHLLEYARKKMGERKVSNDKFGYMFYLYLLTLYHTGIRPFATEKNAIRWSDINTDDKDQNGDTIIKIWRRDKWHASKAGYIIAEPYFQRVMERMRRFQDDHGIDTDWFFAHFQTVEEKIVNGKKTGYKKGDRLTSMHGQLQTYLKKHNLVSSDMPMSDRLAFYSTRHAYVNVARERNPNMPIDVLASQIRNSAQMVERVYMKKDPVRDYATITRNSVPLDDTVDVYDQNGWLRTVKRDSDFHLIAYYQSDTLTCDPPSITWEQYIDAGQDVAS